MITILKTPLPYLELKIKKLKIEAASKRLKMRKVNCPICNRKMTTTNRKIFCVNVETDLWAREFDIVGKILRGP